MGLIMKKIGVNTNGNMNWINLNLNMKWFNNHIFNNNEKKSGFNLNLNSSRAIISYLNYIPIIAPL